MTKTRKKTAKVYIFLHVSKHENSTENLIEIAKIVLLFKCIRGQ